MDLEDQPWTVGVNDNLPAPMIRTSNMLVDSTEVDERGSYHGVVLRVDLPHQEFKDRSDIDPAWIVVDHCKHCLSVTAYYSVGNDQAMR
jgi:hypothetical protein